MKKRFLAGLTLLLAVAPLMGCHAAGRNLYVSPDGSPNGDGSAAAPLDLKTAMTSETLIKPGDTVWIKGGTYQGDILQTGLPDGTAEQPIVYRAVPGERATLKGRLTIKNDYNWIWGLEINAGMNEADGWGGIELMKGDGIKLINLILHDNRGSGIGGWDVGNDHEYYGCLSYRNGNFYNHGIYTQNTVNHTTKKILDCMFFNNLGYGVHCYGEKPALTNYLFEGVVAFGNGLPEGNKKAVNNFLIGGYGNTDNIVVRDCYTYFPTEGQMKRGTDFGYEGKNNGKLTVERSAFIGGDSALWLRKWREITFRDNAVYSPNNVSMYMYTNPDVDYSKSQFEKNCYYSTNGTAISLNGNGQHPAGWREKTGWDKNSEFLIGPPKELWVKVRPNKYEPERANLVIYNWPHTKTVAIDLGKEWNLKAGDKYAVLDPENFWGEPVAQGTYEGHAVEVPVTGAYAPEFAAYVLVKR